MLRGDKKECCIVKFVQGLKSKDMKLVWCLTIRKKKKRETCEIRQRLYINMLDCILHLNYLKNMLPGHLQIMSFNVDEPSRLPHII